MEINRTKFLHLLVFRCPQCGNPMSAWTLSEMQSLETVDASAFDLKCECGWSENWLGLKARRHWAEPWFDRGQENKPLELPRPEVAARELYERDPRSTPIGVPGGVQLVHAGAVGSLERTSFVAIPILPVHAATLGEKSEEVADLDQLKPEALWAAPAEWCPNPTRTISLRVKGNSMSPLILDGYIIAVDTSDISRDELIGKIVVAWNSKEKRLLVSRLIRFDDTDALVSDQRGNHSVSLANGSSWRIIGRVLWWTGKAR